MRDRGVARKEQVGQASRSAHKSQRHPLLYECRGGDQVGQELRTIARYTDSLPIKAKQGSLHDLGHDSAQRQGHIDPSAAVSFTAATILLGVFF
jgi:hypothetical protein